MFASCCQALFVLIKTERNESNEPHFTNHIGNRCRMRDRCCVLHVTIENAAVDRVAAVGSNDDRHPRIERGNLFHEGTKKWMIKPS